jgi:mannose/fructose/N-acetylgalactosamine-specific phosphotransferase system component IIC
MSTFLAVAASLKAILVAASVALARGDMLSVILISVLFNLAELGARPVGQTVPPNSVAVSESNDRGR